MKKNKLIKLFFVIFFVLVLGELYLIGKIYYYSQIQETKIAEAIVVLGASQWNGKPSPVFKARLDKALNLYENKFSKKIILTGGVGEGEEISEAMSGKNYLAVMGVRGEDLLMEEKGRTSKESLDEVLKIVSDERLKSIILVSDGFHMMRLKKMAEDINLEPYLSPVKDGPINKNKISQVKSYIRESWVYILYLLFNI